MNEDTNTDDTGEYVEDLEVVPDVDPENSEDPGSIVQDYRENRDEAVAEAAEKGVEQFDLTLGMDFDVSPGELRDVVQAITEAEAFDVEEASDDTLANFVDVLKALENAAEEARKEVFEPELKERVAVGDSILNLQRRPGSNTWVTDHEAAFDAVLDAGEDPRRVAKVSQKKLREVLGDEAAAEFIRSAEYDYFARTA